MTIHYEDDTVTLHHGDCLDVMASLPDDSIDAICTDPPYGLGFMGKAWDDLPPGLPWARECLRVLKPGGHLLAFGGTRTWHRLAVAVEDAGFEVRDSIAWLNGQGFPKGKSQLKPAFEPVVVAKKRGPIWLNVDGCRVPTSDADKAAINAKHAGMDVETYERRAGSSLNLSVNPMPLKQAEAHAAGRWPTNVVLDGDAADELDEGQPIKRDGVAGALSRGFQSEYVGGSRREGTDLPAAGYGGEGGPSRFFPVFRYQAKAPTRERIKVGDTAHPTVKPLELMRWLVRLVTPPGGVVLEPFAGSGTTVEACLLEGFQCIAIEREADYLPLIEARLARHRTTAEGLPDAVEALALFDFEEPA